MNQAVWIVRSISRSMKKRWDNIRLSMKRRRNGNLMKSRHFDRRLWLRIVSVNPNNLRKIDHTTKTIDNHIDFLSSALTKSIDRLFQILEFQFQLDPRSSTCQDYLFKNVIITGRNGSGKKSIVSECCQRLWNKHLIYFKFLDCLTLKGRTKIKRLDFFLFIGNQEENWRISSHRLLKRWMN